MNPSAEKHILIVGAGAAGRLLAEDIKQNHPHCRISGFIDDNAAQVLPDVLGGIDDFAEVTSKYRIDEIILAIPSTDGKLVRRILMNNKDNRIPIKIVPRNQRIISESIVRYDEVKDLEAEDFLGRPFVRHEVDRLKSFYAGKTIFVTGGAGSIGSEIVRQLIDLDAKVIVYDNSEYLIFMLEQQLKESGQRDKCDLIIGSVTNEHKIDRLLAKYKPDILFHAGAYKHVHLMQDNIDEALTNNVIGTKRVIDAAIRNGIKLVTFISTDKVVNPTSVMGATKKLGEYYINSLPPSDTQFNIVRFGNVINSNGSALPLFERQIDLHRYITLTHEEIKRFFMSIREAAHLVVETTASGSYEHVHILNMGELISMHEVALSLIRSKDLIPGEDVEIRITGLRPGEKMIEELYTEDEQRNMQETEDSRIFILKRNEDCPFDIHQAIATAHGLIDEGADVTKLRQFMNDCFPSLKLGI